VKECIKHTSPIEIMVDRIARKEVANHLLSPLHDEEE
jgi:hypothetical protein